MNSLTKRRHLSPCPNRKLSNRHTCFLNRPKLSLSHRFKLSIFSKRAPLIRTSPNFLVDFLIINIKRSTKIISQNFL